MATKTVKTTKPAPVKAVAPKQTKTQPPKVVAKTPAAKPSPAAKTAKPMKAAAPTTTKKKDSPIPKTESKIAALRSGISALYGPPA